MMRVGGIVLCGGKSKRMGVAKATLPFGDETMLQRVLRLLGQVVEPLVVVAAPGQDVPPLPAGIIVARDERPGQGPLEGLLAGLTAMTAHANAAYVTSCDVPMLTAEFVQTLIGRLEDHDAVVPVEGQFHHPLSAVYHCRLVPRVRALLDADRRRPLFLLEEADTYRIPVEELRLVDPELRTLANLNTPADYLAALQQAALPPPPPEVLDELQRRSDQEID